MCRPQFNQLINCFLDYLENPLKLSRNIPDNHAIMKQKKKTRIEQKNVVSIYLCFEFKSFSRFFFYFFFLFVSRNKNKINLI